MIITICHQSPLTTQLCHRHTRQQRNDYHHLSPIYSHPHLCHPTLTSNGAHRNSSTAICSSLVARNLSGSITARLGYKSSRCNNFIQLWSQVWRWIYAVCALHTYAQLGKTPLNFTLTDSIPMRFKITCVFANVCLTQQTCKGNTHVILTSCDNLPTYISPSISLPNHLQCFLSHIRYFCVHF
jgi:hypothetical protein